MNRAERAKMVEAMDIIARNLNDEDYLDVWLSDGVADCETDFADDCYTSDKNFPELMQLFAVLMRDALTDNGQNVQATFYCDRITNHYND